MAAMNEVLKSELMRRGVWGDYMRLREDARARGEAPAMCRNIALARVAPDLAGTYSGRKGRPRRGESARERLAEVLGEEAVAAGASAADSQDARKRPVAPSLRKDGSSTVREPPKAPGGVTGASPCDVARNRPKPSDFAGRRASWGETIDWVIANLAFDEADVDLMSAPDSKALAYYYGCRDSVGFRADFMLKVGAQRLPKKVDEEERSGGDNWDGKEEYDLLAAMREVGG